jgi:galactokinase
VEPRARAVVDTLGDVASAVRVVRAPGRVNLIGDHTDYHAGLCLPMAIDRECVIALGARARGIRARSLELEGVVELASPVGVEPSSLDPPWGRFVAAAAQLAGGPPGAELVVSSSVPAGSGLSSSAALCVALTLAFDPTAVDDRRAWAITAQAIEVLATGVSVGLMDQLASVFGQAGAALLIDCQRLTVEAVPLPATMAVGVVHSGLPRTLAGSAYQERRAACDASARRLGLASLREATAAQVRDDPIARHVVSENQRVVDAVAALRAGDLATLAALLEASHASLRDDFAVSTPELDRLVELLLEEGARGARLTGAGFGGCVVALTTPADREVVLARAVERYRAETGRAASAFPVEAADGAGMLAVT